MKKIIVTLLFLTIPMLFASCSNIKNINEKTVTVKKISPVEAKKRLDSEKNIILLDVRTESEYKEKHIPGSILIPVDSIQDGAKAKLIDKNAPIFVYCRSGNRSATASKILVQLGYVNVYDMGGINNWPYETVP